MTINIYVNNNNNVETYIANIDLEKLKQLESRIDISFGKGEPKTYRGSYLKSEENKKVELLSQKQVGVGSSWACPVCCSMPHEVPVYKFRYYAYEPHELSKICKYFLEHNYENSQITISKGLKSLLSFKATNKKERKYFYEILSCFQFIKYTPDEIVESTINLNDKISIITKLKQIFVKATNLEQTILIPKSYLDLVNKELRFLETMDKKINYLSQFKFYEFTEQGRKEYPQKTLLSLPEKYQFEKHFSTN